MSYCNLVMAEWSDDSSECREEMEEMEIASLLHEYMMWQEVYAVDAFLKRKKQDRDAEAAAPVHDLIRSNAGIWNPRDLFPKIHHDNRDNSQNSQNKKKG